MNKFRTLSYVLIGITLAGCNGLGKMAKNFSQVKHEVTPNPVELHGDSVAIAIKGTYPAKYFAKKVDATVTPMMKSSSAETNFKSVTIVGEKSTTAGTKINYKAGGSFNYTDKIAYTPDMAAADVMVKASGMKGKTTKDLGSIKVADGTIVTPLLVQSDEKTIIGKDEFQRITPSNYEGTMYYLINTATVNASFKNKVCGFNNKTEFSMLDSAVKALSVEPYIIKGATITGHASPDGKEALNTTLAANRAKASTKHVAGLLKKIKMKVSADSSFFTQNTVNEDWAGFQTLMSASDMAQKDMILRIVSSNSDAEAREMEIKKMGKAYEEIAEGVLPKLRRSAVVINADKVGRSDEQINATLKSNPDSLTIEEILYAATLTEDNNEKLSIYQTAERLFPQDWRTANNAGMVKFNMGDIDGAMAQFNKADQINADNAIVKNNLGACYSRKGDRANASLMYASAAGAGPEVNHNQGILDIRNGNYTMAVSNLNASNSFNSALAKLLAGDKDGAMSTIQSSDDKNTAMGHYLMAVISARKGDANGVVSHLTTAVGMDSSLKAKAKEDREFIKWFNDGSFQAVAN
jgi:Flp pilus assembly protein TadD/outer membrane protein OmpA-like peptidoglycan-associated protein